MDLRVLGPLEAVADGNPVALGGPRQRLVLAVLVVADGHPLSVDTLVDRVWGDDPPGDAPSSIHTYVSRLRSVIGDRMERSGAGYALRLESDVVDAHRFEKLAAQGRSVLAGDPQAAGRFLREGLALWRGRPFGDLADEPALRPEVTRLEELRVQAVEDRVEADLAVGHHAELVPELEVLTTEYPLRERFRSQQMLALYRSGRQAESLRVYRDTRTMLVEELGIDPSPDLQALENRILNQDPDLAIDLRPHVECVALLFTDLEDSTVLWELHPEAMQPALGQHDRLLDDAVTGQGGRVFKRTGDGICAAFEDVGSAVAAAEQIQHSLATADWPDTPALKTRTAIDVGEVEARGGDYYGPTLNRCARIMASGHGGQILLSEQSVEALKECPAGWQVKALGEYRFRGLGRPQAVYQLVVEGLPAEFPALRIDRLPPPLPGSAFGRTVRGYELREQLGAGDFGVVYRAYQPTVGREVVVKVIRPEYVDQPAFVRRFETEAQLVAQLEHPHIVALYDYWRDPDGAYLVFRWLRGGSLRQALDRGPFHLDAAMRLLNQVGEALAHAHRQGVAHRDLKPSNVLLDEDDNAYLTDFGIAARLVDASETGRPYATSPAYVPPEELRGEPLTAAADIYGLGLLTFEVLTGRPPPMDEPLPAPSGVRAEVPAALDEVIVKATADLPADRFPTVDQFLDAVREALGEPIPGEEAVFTPARNPYKGLRAFGETDSTDFFGRDRTIAELLQALGEHRLVTVVGPSGSGKSSVVRAGLVPALRAGGLPGSREWLVTAMFPGSHPFEELEAALLRIAADKPSGLDEILASDRRGLVRATKQMFTDESTVVMVVDQFEELFTLTGDEETRRRFLDALVEVASDQRSRLKIVVTLRADFFDRPLQYPEFADLLRAGLVTISAQSDDELARAIAGPAVGVGVKLEADLVDHIISDVHDQPGALPLLQYALTELFAARHTDLLTIAGYQTTGGVTGALGKHAEDLYQNFDETAQTAIRQVFLRLVTVAEGREDTRRRVRRTELEGLTVDRATLNHLLKTYGEHRLLTFDRDPVTRGPTVEVAHEALLAEWDRLAGWIDERRETLLLHQRFAAALSEWEAAGRDPGYLLSGGRLVQFETWADGTDLTLTKHEQDFLDRSRRKENIDRISRRRRRRWIMGGFALAALAAILLAIWALLAQRDAERSAAEARARELSLLALDTLETDPEEAILLALHSVGVLEAVGLPVAQEPINALHQALPAFRVVERYPGGEVVGYSPDGSLLATASGADTAIWSTDTHELIRVLPAPADQVTAGVAFSPDGEHLAASYTPGGASVVILWDAETGEPVASFDGLESDPPIRMAFSPDGGSLAISGNGYGPVIVFDVESGAERYRIGQGTPGYYAGYPAYSRDGRWLVFGAASELDDAGRIEIHDAGTGEELRSLGDFNPADVAFSPSGEQLAAVRFSPGSLHVFDIETSETILAVDTEGFPIEVEWSPDGRMLAISGNKGTPRLFDSATGEEALSLPGAGTVVWSLAFRPDGERIAGAGMVGETVVWDPTPFGGREVATVPSPYPLHYDVLYQSDGKAFFVISREGPQSSLARLDAITGELIAEVPGQSVIWPATPLISVDAGLAATLPAESRAAIIDLESFVEVARLPEGFYVKALSRDGRLALLNQLDGEGARVAKIDGWETVFEFDDDSLAYAYFDPEGELVSAETGSTGAWLVDLPGSTILASFDVPDAPGPFSPDGSMLAAFLIDGRIKLLDVDSLLAGATPEDAIVFEWAAHDGAIGIVVFNPDGSRIASWSVDDLHLRVWDTTNGALVADLGTNMGGFGFHPEEDWIVVGKGSSLRVHTLDTDELLDIARSRITRGFTDAECATYRIDPCPTLEEAGSG